MNNKLSPVVVGVIIVVAILITFGLASIFKVNMVTHNGPNFNTNSDQEKYDNYNNSENNLEDNENKDNYYYDDEDLKDNQYENDNNYNNDTDDELMMKCRKRKEDGLEENYFYFKYDTVYNDNYINKYVIKLTVNTDIDINEYYSNAQLMNNGKYRMNLEGRTIISEIDPNWSYWNNKEFKYKNMAYRYINKEFVENGYSCE